MRHVCRGRGRETAAGGSTWEYDGGRLVVIAIALTSSATPDSRLPESRLLGLNGNRNGERRGA